MAKKKETVGDILLDLEVVLDKLYDNGLQLGDVLGIVYTQTHAHRMDAVETYNKDNTHPVLSYHHKDNA
jgi:hypothetical protein